MPAFHPPLFLPAPPSHPSTSKQVPTYHCHPPTRATIAQPRPTTQPRTTSPPPTPSPSRAKSSPVKTRRAPKVPSQTPPTPPPPTEIVLCHATADFDSLACAVGLAKLRGPSCKVVLPAGVHTTVHRYLTLHKSLFPIIDVKLVDPTQIRWLGIADTCSKQRLGVAASWIPYAEKVVVMDHHVGAICDVDGADVDVVIDKVGAATTLVVERLRDGGVELSSAESTLLALAIHADTGSLAFETTTPRDAMALAWLLAQGACQRTIAQYARGVLDSVQQRLLAVALDGMKVKERHGMSVASVILESPRFVKGVAAVAQTALELSDLDALVLALVVPNKEGSSVSLIGRARADGVDFGRILGEFGGGGHAKAASASFKVKVGEVEDVVEGVVERVIAEFPPPVLARDVMSREVKCVLPEQSMRDAARILFESGHTGLAVVKSVEEGVLVGVVSRQDVALAERRGRLDTPVKGWMGRKVVMVEEHVGLYEIERLLVQHGVGRVPVVRDGVVVGIVTRSDVLRQRRLGGV